MPLDAFEDYPKREKITPFYSGYRAGLKFDNTFMMADTWSVQITDEPIDITSVQLYRASGINDGLLSALYPQWESSGTPATYTTGGIRQTKIKVHGFYKDTKLPTIGQSASISLLMDGLLFFKSEQATVISALYNVTVKGAVEFDIELIAIPTSTQKDTDVLPRL
jgi:hypothetical protein